MDVYSTGYRAPGTDVKVRPWMFGIAISRIFQLLGHLHLYACTLDHGRMVLQLNPIMITIASPHGLNHLPGDVPGRSPWQVHELALGTGPRRVHTSSSRSPACGMGAMHGVVTKE